jgi:hypothetical protein
VLRGPLIYLGLVRAADERDSLSPIRHRPLLAGQGKCVAVTKPSLNFRISAGSATDRTSPDGVPHISDMLDAALENRLPDTKDQLFGHLFADILRPIMRH